MQYAYVFPDDFSRISFSNFTSSLHLCRGLGAQPPDTRALKRLFRPKKLQFSSISWQSGMSGSATANSSKKWGCKAPHPCSYTHDIDEVNGNWWYGGSQQKGAIEKKNIAEVGVRTRGLFHVTLSVAPLPSKPSRYVSIGIYSNYIRWHAAFVLNSSP